MKAGGHRATLGVSLSAGDSYMGGEGVGRLHTKQSISWESLTFLPVTPLFFPFILPAPYFTPMPLFSLSPDSEAAFHSLTPD